MPCELAKRIDGQQVRRLERLTVPLIVEFGLLSRNNVAGALTEIEEAERPAVLPTFPLKPLLGNDRTTPSLVDRQVIGDDRIASSLTVLQLEDDRAIGFAARGTDCACPRLAAGHR